MLSALLVACGGDPATPKDRVGSLIDSMEQAVEAGSATDAAGLLHPQYRDATHPDRAAASRSLSNYLRRHRGIHLITSLTSVDVAPDGTSAQAVVYVAMSGVVAGSIDALAGLRADFYRFELDVALNGGDWRILHSRWRRTDVSEWRAALAAPSY